MTEPQVYRDLGYIGLGRQSAQGTAVSPSKFYKFNNSALLIAQAVADFRSGNERSISFSFKETAKYAGSFQAFTYADELAFLLTMALGQDVVSGGADPYLHTITVLDTLPFVTAEVEYAEGQLIDRLVDGKISQLLIEGDVSKPLFATPTFMGAGAAAQSVASVVNFSDDPSAEGAFTFLDATFTIGGPTDGAVLALQVQKVAITINQNVQDVYGPGALTPIVLLEKGLDVHLAFTVMLSGPDLYRLTYYGTEAGTSPSRIIGTGSFVLNASIAGASPQRDFTITLPNINYTMAKPSISPNANPTTLEVTATAVKSGATLPINATVHNGVSTAYSSIQPKVQITSVTDPVTALNETAVAASGTNESGADVSISVWDGTKFAAAGPFPATADTATTWSIASADVSDLAVGTIWYIATATTVDGKTWIDKKSATKSA